MSSLSLFEERLCIHVNLSCSWRRRFHVPKREIAYKMQTSRFVPPVYQLRRLLCPSCYACGHLQQLSTVRNLAGCAPNIPPLKRYNPRRAVLYVPGNDERKLLKIPGLKVDCAVMDCEDGVAMNRKVEARETIRKMLDVLEFGPTECVVRVNSVSSGLMEEDLGQVLQANKLPETIMVPKVNSAQELVAITHSLHRSLRDRQLAQKVSLVLFVESAISLLNLPEICSKGTELSLRSSTFQVDGLVFGSDDFCADIGAKRSVDGQELLYARQKLVTVAKAFRLQAIDMVHIDYKDLEALKDQSIKGADMGFTGKQVIHPGQIPVVQEAFSPSAEQVTWARELIQAFEEHQSSGKGAFTFRGHMIDMPLLLQAKNIQHLASSIED